MIFVVRTTHAEPPADAGVRFVRVRATPPLVATRPGEHDHFSVSTESALVRLRAQGWTVVPLHDGWYADDAEGGVAVWGNGRYWEVRATPFEIITQG